MPLLPLEDSSHSDTVELFTYTAAAATASGEAFFPAVPFTQVTFVHVMTAAAATLNPADLCVPRIEYRFGEFDTWVDLCTFRLYQSPALPGFPDFGGWQNDVRVARRRNFDGVGAHNTIRGDLGPTASRLTLTMHPSQPQVRATAFIANASGTADFSGVFLMLPTAARQSRGPRRRANVSGAGIQWREHGGQV